MNSAKSIGDISGDAAKGSTYGLLQDIKPIIPEDCHACARLHKQLFKLRLQGVKSIAVCCFLAGKDNTWPPFVQHILILTYDWAELQRPWVCPLLLQTNGAAGLLHLAVDAM